MNKFRYYVIFVYYFTKYTWFYPIKAKYEVPTIFEHFNKLTEIFFQTNFKTVYIDGGGEYQSLAHTLAKFGIQHLT